MFTLVLKVVIPIIFFFSKEIDKSNHVAPGLYNCITLFFPHFSWASYKIKKNSNFLKIW